MSLEFFQKYFFQFGSTQLCMLHLILFSSTLVHCQWGNWGSWSHCIGSCPSPGSRSRTRSKTVEACGGGQECQGSTKEFDFHCHLSDCEYHFHFRSFFYEN